MNTDELDVQFCSSNSVLVINPRGRLKLVYVPFPVYRKELVDGIRTRFIVDEVRSTQEDRLVYVINGKAYFHHLFYIEVSF
jgi:hypothetical protein